MCKIYYMKFDIELKDDTYIYKESSFDKCTNDNEMYDDIRIRILMLLRDLTTYNKITEFFFYMNN